MTIDELLDQYREAARESARLAAAVERLDEERRIALSAQVVACGDMATTKAEHVARASVEYRRASAALAETRDQAARVKAEAEYLHARIEAWRSRMASARVAKQIEMGERR